MQLTELKSHKPSAGIPLDAPAPVIAPLTSPGITTPTLAAPSLTGKIGAKLSTSDKVFGAERFASFSLKKGFHTVGHHLWGAPIAMGAVALLSEWDHHNQKNHIKREYNQEIAALTGKTPHSVGINDLERVAKSNPVIGEAVNRSRLRRNLSIGITVLGGAAALAIGAALTGPIAGLGIVTAIGAHSFAALSAVGITSFSAEGISAVLAATTASTLAFIGIETTSEKIGEARLGLKEPDFKAVNRNPARQGELSASSQVEYLEHLHARRQPITETQVMTMFATVNPELATRVQKRYGAPFGKLPETLKQQAMRQFGADYDICGITSDINNHKIRVQEIAFAAAGQQSGVTRFEPPQLVEAQNHNHALERENQMLRAKLYDAGQEKLAMQNATVTAAIPGQQEARRQASWAVRETQRPSQLAAGIA